MSAAPRRTGAEPDHAVQQPHEVVATVLHSAAADTSLALLVTEVDGPTGPVIRWSNLGATELLGRAASDLVGRPLAEFVRTADDVPLVSTFRRERATTGSVTVRTAVGESVECRIRTVPGPGGRLWAVTMSPASSDVELALRASADAHQHRFEVLAERSPVPTMMSEQGMRLAHVNDAMCALVGVTSDKLTGTGWMAYAHPEDLGRISEAAVSALEGEESEIEARFVDHLRRTHHAIVRFTPLHTPRVGDGFVATVEDVTERRAFEEQLSYQATHDSLTGLPLRTKLWEHISAAMDDPDTPLTCMFLDLDNFKLVNDSLGHTAGDALLVEIAQRLLGSVRPGDLVARFGGDEFVVACTTGSLDGALELANRILRVVSEPVPLDGIEIHPRASIGVVVRGPDHQSPDDLIRDCDIAMYQAKGTGKGRVTVLDEGARTAATDSFLLVADLRQALRDRTVTLCYQPLVRFDDGSSVLESVEALARWHHPTRGAVPADVFVKLAEENGLVRELGDLVLDTACAALLDWQRELGPLAPPRVNVNLSALQMSDHLLVQTVNRTMRANGIRPDQLCLEITESALMKDPGAASLMLSELRERGVTIAIDDFGTGYSSLAYLRRLAVSYLKVDQSFVAELQDGHTAIAQAVISLANNLGIGVVAEGVETRCQLSMLRAMGCSVAQGFGISPPLTSAELIEWCRSGRPTRQEMW
ncbi:MAG TPA: EAL domain-containing protein [Nocardioides sp.]|nr:EAL domain-containing protein [Nocardioides sp.]